MSRSITANVAVILSFAAASVGCAAEHLEARDGAHGATNVGATTSPVVRPTDLRATEKQLRTTGPTSDVGSTAPMSPTDGTTHDHGSDAPVYRCPMHPEVQSSSPGTCPKCGMTLKTSVPSP